MEIGEFHWSGGWFWKRMEDGSVRIRKQMPRVPPMGDFYGPYEPADLVAIIPAAEWASIVAHCSAKGETGETYQAAVAFHMTERAPA